MNRNVLSPDAPYTVLRLYFEHDAPIAGRTGWRKLLGQTLAFNVTAGYLRDDALHHGHHEHLPVKHPQCVELIDSPEHVARFLKQNEPLLTQVRVLLRESDGAKR